MAPFPALIDVYGGLHQARPRGGGEEGEGAVNVLEVEISLSLPPLPKCRVACTNLDPVEVVKKVKELCQRLVVVPGEDGLSKEAQRNATVMFLSLMRSHLASKRLLKVCGGGQGVRGCEGEGGRVCVEGASKEAQRNATVMFLSLMRSHLASKRLLKVWVCWGGRGGGARWAHCLHVLAVCSVLRRPPIYSPHPLPSHRTTSSLRRLF